MEDPAFRDTVGMIMDAVRECDEEADGDPPMCDCSMFLAYHLYCAYEWTPNDPMEPTERPTHGGGEDDGE